MPIPNFDFGAFWFESRDEVNPVAKEEGRGDEEVFEVFKTIRAESASAEVMDPPVFLEKSGRFCPCDLRPTSAAEWG